jgi:hypothetical protein
MQHALQQLRVSFARVYVDDQMYDAHTVVAVMLRINQQLLHGMPSRTCSAP